MAYPTISINNSSGNNANSGAGPATPLTGTGASYSTTTVTLDAGTDLSGVDTTGLHVLYLVTSTGRRFFKITAKAGSGGATPTVTVHVAPTGTASGLTWSIGGKRKDFETTNSNTKLLFAASDAIVGMTVDIEETGTDYTNTSTITVSAQGDLTTGRITYKSSSATKPIIKTATNSVKLFTAASTPTRLTFRNLSFKNTAGTKSIGYDGSVTTTVYCTFEDCVFDGFTEGINDGFGHPSLKLIGVEIKNCTTRAHSIGNGDSCSWIHCNIHDNAAGVKVTFSNGGLWIIDSCQIYNNTGKGWEQSATGGATFLIRNNHVRGNGSDGIAVSGAMTPTWLIHYNNYYHLNGAYDISFNCTADALAGAVQFNDYNFYGASGQASTSGTRNNLAAGVHDGTFTSDPNASASSPVLTLAGLKAAGYPQSFPGGYTGYGDVGPLQHQDSGGGGSTMRSYVG